MSVTYQREGAAAALGEIMPLMALHWLEVAYSKEPFDPNIDGYLAIDAAGMLRLYTARDEGQLVGYACFVLAPSINHRTLITATESGLFMLEKARKGRIALRLLDFAEAGLVADGAREVHYRVPKEHPALGIIVARRGAQLEESVYVRRF